MKCVALISGRGSNLQALLDACSQPGFPAKIIRVISNVPDVQGLERAAKAGVKTQVIPHKNYPNRESFEAELIKQIDALGADLVLLAGFMRVLTDGFVNHYAGRLINIHPSLLPAFKGTHTHKRALEAGVKLAGCTVHFVVPEVDSGPIILQAAVPVLGDDTEETLAARVLEQEHICYPRALEWLASGQAVLEGGIVKLQKERASTSVNALINP